MASVDPDEARRRFTTAPVARLATARPDGRPHVVPITFAVDGDTVATAIDHKPKRDRRLQRLANIAANPSVSILADAYHDDWSRLWWARADGQARIVEHGPLFAWAVAALQEGYAQYRQRPPEGPAIVVTVERWSGWASSHA